MKHNIHGKPLLHQDKPASAARKWSALAKGPTGHWLDVCYALPCSGASRFVCKVTVWLVAARV